MPKPFYLSFNSMHRKVNDRFPAILLRTRPIKENKGPGFRPQKTKSDLFLSLSVYNWMLQGSGLKFENMIAGYFIDTLALIK